MLLRALALWLAIIALETLHGIARVALLEPLVGDFRARQLAVLTGSLLILTVAWFGVRWLRPASTRQALAVGALWVALTVAFELALGRLVMELPWERLAQDYDLSRGGLLGLGLMVMLLAPSFAAARQRLV
jgi:hypothetical protein